MESLVVHIFHRGYFDNRFEKFFICTPVYNMLNLAEDKA